MMKLHSGFFSRVLIAVMFLGFVLVLVQCTQKTPPPVVSVSPQVLNNPRSAFSTVYEKVAPAVVKIEVKSEIMQQIDPLWRQFFGMPQQQMEPQQSVGSGVIIDREGHILTNNHVVAGAKEIKVSLSNNEKYDATVVGADPETDVAVIKLKSRTLPENYVAELGDSDQLKPGDWAIAIGNPLGLDRTITVGVISALGRKGLQSENGPRIQNFIQTDAQINPGNSGGALCDINGKVIGINDMYTEQYAGIGFAIPINLAKSIMTRILSGGKVAHGYLGVQIDNIDSNTKAALDLPNTDGVIVNALVSGAPAQKAGIKVGDVITGLDGKTIKNTDDLINRITAHAPGEIVKLDVIESGVKKTVSCALGDYSDYANASGTSVSGESVWRGIHVVSLDNQMYNLPANITSGVLVVGIDPNSPASGSQIQTGDIITQIVAGKVRTDINTMQDFTAFVNANRNNDRPMLVYRTQILGNGRMIRGFVSIPEGK
jgi:serine protease Do